MYSHNCIKLRFESSTSLMLLNVSDMDKAAKDNRTNQCNPNHGPTGPGKVPQSSGPLALLSRSPH
jgi:hypothetical protein